MDEHFRTAPFDKNVPVLMGLLNVWNVNFLGAETHAVLPYDQYLHRFPAYLQQLTMESNGKSVRADGSFVDYSTGEVSGASPAPTVSTLSTSLSTRVPALSLRTSWPSQTQLTPPRMASRMCTKLFLANFFAQTQALAFGKTEDEVRC